MKKTLYLHIGLAKTASTTIQYFLHKNKDVLKDRGVFYPSVNDHKFHGKRDEINGRVLYKNLVNETKRFCQKFWEEEFLKQINEANVSKVIISEELFSFSNPSILDKIDLKDFNVKIVVYVRRSVEYLASGWAQAVRSRDYKNFNGQYTINEFLEQPYSVIDNIYNYANKFGNENIILRPLDKSQLFEGNIYKDICHVLNVEHDDKFVTTTDQNPSLNRNDAEICHAINVLDLSLQDHALLKNKILTSFTSEPKVLNTLSDQTIKTVTDLHADKEKQLAKDFLSQEFLFSEKYPNVYMKPRDFYKALNVPIEKWDILLEAINISKSSSLNPWIKVKKKLKPILKKLLRK